MDLSEIVRKITDVGIPVIVIILLGLIKIPKLEINIWKWLAKTIGKALNADLTTKVDSMQKDITNVKTELTDYKSDFETYVAEDLKNTALARRRVIIEFNDDLMNGKRYSKERWDSILEIVSDYNTYCNTHENFINKKAELSIKNIENEYQTCLREGRFL